MSIKKSKIIYVGIILIITILLMLCFAYNTSPLFNYFGVDSGMYLYIGKQLCEGKLLYYQVFDHKGPLIFIINMIPQLFINGALGVFIIEIIFAFLGAVLLFKMSQKHISKQFEPLCLIVSISYLVFSAAYFNGGNYTEEYSNLFSIITLFIVDKYFKEGKVSKISAFLVGFSFAFAFFLRPNNIALILAVIIFIIISLIKKRSKSLLKLLIFGFLGILTVFLPIFIYHLAVGTFSDMMYGTILHNLIYCNSRHKFLMLPNAKNSFQTIFLIVGLLINLSAIFCNIISGKLQQSVFFIIADFFVLMSTSMSGYNFLYYQTLFAPLLSYSTISIIVFFTTKEEKSQIVSYKKRKHNNSKVIVTANKKKFKLSICCVTFILIFSTTLIYLSVKPFAKKEEAKDLKENAQILYSHIPNNQKNDVFCYDMGARFLFEVNAPCNFKYFTMQSWMGTTNPKIKEECATYVNEKRPEYVITDGENLRINESLQRVIEQNYKVIYSNELGDIFIKSN